MARCRCSPDACTCIVVGGAKIEVVGDGSRDNPYLISSTSTCVDCDVGGNPGDVLTLYPDGQYRPVAPSGGGGGGGGAVVDGISITGNGTVPSPFRVCLETYDDLTALAANCTASPPVTPPNKASVRVGDAFADPAITECGVNGVAQLDANGYEPQIAVAWPPGAAFTVNSCLFHWSGPGWLPDAAPDKSLIFPNDMFPVDPAVIAEDAANAANLEALGYFPASNLAPWTTGQFFVIGSFRFFYDGANWAPGIAP